MILTTHALTGAVVGKNVDNTFLVIILSLVLHFLMDTFRHGEYFDDRTATFKNTWWKVGLDFLVFLSLLVLLFYFQNWDQRTLLNVSMGVLFSLIPDGLTVLHSLKVKLPFLGKIKKFHALSHRYSKWPKYSKDRKWKLKNVKNDIIFSIIALTILLFL